MDAISPLAKKDRINYTSKVKAVFLYGSFIQLQAVMAIGGYKKQ